MPPLHHGEGPLRAPLDAALEQEILRIELRIAQVWRSLGLLGIALSLFLGLRASHGLVLWGSAGAGAYLAWFSVVVHRLQSGRATRGFRVATSIAEGAGPWVFLVVLAHTEGPAYALGSWVPPLLFGGMVIVSTVRLRPESSRSSSGSRGASRSSSSYFAWLRGALPLDIAATPLYSPRVQNLALCLARHRGRARDVRLADAAQGHRPRRQLGTREGAVRKVPPRPAPRLGGMGTVFEALYCPEGGFERPVAIKRIHPHLAREESFVTFFRNEAELSARLVHPNIVQVLDFGSVDGTYFLAMELVEGLTLRSFMRRAWSAGIPVPPSIVAYIGREILSGLAYSHGAARGADGSRLKVVHRDLCPANVLLSKNGEVKISDFGVARALRDADSTHTRTVAGHAGYMAPEQALAQPIDERCDLFAVGVVLWELACARPLFQRGAEGPTLVAMLSAEIESPSAVTAALDPGWDALILRALARDADQRFASAGAMSEAIGALADARIPAADELCALVNRVLGLPEPAPEVIRSATRRATVESEAETQVAGRTAPGA